MPSRRMSGLVSAGVVGVRGIVGSQGMAEDKLETRRLVDGAKSVLMERHGMSESDAFAFVQKTAMGTRSRMVDVARQVLEGTLEP